MGKGRVVQFFFFFLKWPAVTELHLWSLPIRKIQSQETSYLSNLFITKKNSISCQKSFLNIYNTEQGVFICRRSLQDKHTLTQGRRGLHSLAWANRSYGGCTDIAADCSELPSQPHKCFHPSSHCLCSYCTWNGSNWKWDVCLFDIFTMYRALKEIKDAKEMLKQPIFFPFSCLNSELFISFLRIYTDNKREFLRRSGEVS